MRSGSMMLIDFKALWMFEIVVESWENIARSTTVLRDLTSSRFIIFVSRRCYKTIAEEGLNSLQHKRTTGVLQLGWRSSYHPVYLSVASLHVQINENYSCWNHTRWILVMHSTEDSQSANNFMRSSTRPTYIISPGPRIWRMEKAFSGCNQSRQRIQCFWAAQKCLNTGAAFLPQRRCKIFTQRTCRYLGSVHSRR